MSRHYDARQANSSQIYILKFSDYIFYTCFIQMFCYSFFYFLFCLEETRARVWKKRPNFKPVDQGALYICIYIGLGGMNTRMENEKSSKRSNNKMYGCFVDSNVTIPPHSFGAVCVFFSLEVRINLRFDVSCVYFNAMVLHQGCAWILILFSIHRAIN